MEKLLYIIHHISASNCYGRAGAAGGSALQREGTCHCLHLERIHSGNGCQPA